MRLTSTRSEERPIRAEGHGPGDSLMCPESVHQATGSCIPDMNLAIRIGLAPVSRSRCNQAIVGTEGNCRDRVVVADQGRLERATSQVPYSHSMIGTCRSQHATALVV